MIRHLLFVVLALVSFQAKAAENCSVPTINTLNNQTVDGIMTVKSGKRCSIRLTRSAGPTYSAEIVQRPAHGTASTSGNHVRYVSNTGFTGQDSFTYARKGFDTRNNPVVRTVRIAVTVVP